jgi:hypothetical protein
MALVIWIGLEISLEYQIFCAIQVKNPGEKFARDLLKNKRTFDELSDVFF